MRKITLLLVSFVLSSTMAMSSERVDLSQHGVDLMKAPFVIRYKFEQMHHIYWTKTTYDQRKVFLTSYYKKAKEEQKKNKAAAKEERNYNRQVQREKKEERKRLAGYIKAEQKSSKEVQKEASNQRKNMDRISKSQTKEISSRR